MVSSTPKDTKAVVREISALKGVRSPLMRICRAMYPVALWWYTALRVLISQPKHKSLRIALGWRKSFTLWNIVSTTCQDFGLQPISFIHTYYFPSMCNTQPLYTPSLFPKLPMDISSTLQLPTCEELSAIKCFESLNRRAGRCDGFTFDQQA